MVTKRNLERIENDSIGHTYSIMDTIKEHEKLLHKVNVSYRMQKVMGNLRMRAGRGEK